ncbi:hypothetical protein GCM10029964_053930 [Kibdelosporangium lantanae]
MRNPTVASVMTKDPYTVGLDTGYKTIVDLLTSKQISAVAVLAPDGFPMGVVSERTSCSNRRTTGTCPAGRPARPPRWSPRT